MARAGDGAARSAARQRTRIIRVRVTPAEQDRTAAAASEHGYASVAGYLRDRGLQGVRAHCPGAAVIGELGIIGSLLTTAADLLEQKGEDEAALRCRDGSHRIIGLQHLLMGEA